MACGPDRARQPCSMAAFTIIGPTCICWARCHTSSIRWAKQVAVMAAVIVAACYIPITQLSRQA